MERSVLEETIYNRYIVQQEEREPDVRHRSFRGPGDTSRERGNSVGGERRAKASCQTRGENGRERCEGGDCGENIPGVTNGPFQT